MWKQITVGNHSAQVFSPDTPRFLLIFLPDLDGVGLSNSSTWSELLAKNRIACVCPAGCETWWTDRIWPPFDVELSAELYVVDRVLPWALGHFRLRSNSCGLLGCGAGGQGALRIAFRHTQSFRAVAGLGSAIDLHDAFGHETALDDLYPSREHARQETALLHIHADWPPYIYFACDPDSPWFRGNDRLREKLQALGTPHQVDFQTPACGHSWAYYDRMAPSVMQFLVSGLESESRRLI